MPVQTPQWTEVLSCPVCCKDFSPSGRQPVSLSCGHTACRMCLSKLHRQQCPFDQTAISKDVDMLPTNYAILQLVAGQDVMRDPSRKRIPDGMKPGEFEVYQDTQGVIEEIALYLRSINKTSSNSLTSSTNSSTTSSGGQQLLSRPIQRKLVTLVNCQLVEEEGRARAVRAARSLGERIVTELIIQHQNPQQLSTNLWAAVRARGCQFLGPAMQEETLKLVLLALEDGTPLSRKVLVMFVVQKLEQQFPQASKTSVGHVVQLLYRASCFKVTKRMDESSLMQLKEEFRNYDSLRREHDAQIVQIAIEAGLRISPDQWSSLLYGDLNHKSHMQSIIDKLQTPASFASSIQELTICLQRSGDPVRLAQLRPQLEKLAAIDPSPGAMISTWEGIKAAVDAVKKVLQGLVDFMQNYSQNKKALDLQTQNIKYKTSLCRDVMQKGGCPRGPSCTFAHSEEELERYRSKSRQILTALNNQNKNQSSVTDTRRGENEDSLYTEEITKSWAGSESRFGSESGIGTGSELRTASVGGYKSESGLLHRPAPGLSSSHQNSRARIAEDEDLDENISSLFGLKDRNQAHSPSPEPPPQSGFALGGRLPTSNARMYLASRSMSHNESEMSSASSREADRSLMGREAERSMGSGSSGSRPPQLQQKVPVRGLPQEVEARSASRYTLPPDDNYYFERRLPPSDSPLHYKSASSPPPVPQPRILVPTVPPPSPQPETYPDQKRVKHAYQYISPVGARYLYPESVPAQPPVQQQSLHRRPVVQRYVDPQTMKAYDVIPVPADDYVEPSAPPQSLVSSREFHLQPRPGEPVYREPAEYYAAYDQPSRHSGHSRTPQSLQELPPVGTPLIIQATNRGGTEAVNGQHSKHSKLPIQRPASGIAAPLPKQTLKVERGPSLTELKGREEHLVTMLDEIQDDNDNDNDKDKDWEEASSSSSWVSSRQSVETPPVTSVWDDVAKARSTWSVTTAGSASHTASSSLWAGSSQSTTPKSSGLSFTFNSIPNDDDDGDSDHRKNGIDVDADEEIMMKEYREQSEKADSKEEERLGSDVGSYNPWTSQALFTPNTGKAVKETPTNYTMTYSKVLVRHVSTNENEEQCQKPHPCPGAHNMQDFEAMSMKELQQTLMEVEEQDQRAGSSHFERGQKIHMEMVRREANVPDSSSHFANSPIAPLPAQLVNKEPIFHMYTKYLAEGQQAHQGGAGHKGVNMSPYGPVSGSARSMGSNTGPLKVSAGTVENTMPVNMTVQDCQVAPGFQTPDGEGYYIDTPQAAMAHEINPCALLHNEDWEKNVDKLVECDPRAEQKLKHALSQVRTRIQAKETAKHARNTFLVNRDEKVLGNEQRIVDHHHGHPAMSTHSDPPQPSESRAVQMQESVISRYARQPQPHPQHLAERQLPPPKQIGGAHVTVPSPYPWPERNVEPYSGSRSQFAGHHLVQPEMTATRPGRYRAAAYETMDGRGQEMSKSKQQLEEADRRIALQIQDKEREEYLRHLEKVQRRNEEKERQEHHRRYQEEEDRRMARSLAMREAMRGYPYEPPYQ